MGKLNYPAPSPDVWDWLSAAQANGPELAEESLLHHISIAGLLVWL